MPEPAAPRPGVLQPREPIMLGGWLLGLVWAAVWAVVAFVPLTVSDDIFGPLQGAHWAIFPAAAAPIGSGADTATSSADQVVHVPPGSRMTLNIDESDLQASGVDPTVRCFTRDSAGPWRALPAAKLPLNRTGTLKQVRLTAFRAVTGELTVRCVGSETLDLKREDPGVQRRLELTIDAARFLWPALVTLVFWGPVLLFRQRQRRRRQRRRGRKPIPGANAPTSTDDGLPPPYLTP